MKYIKPTVSILLISLFLISSVSSSITADNNLPSENIFTNSLGIKGLYLYNWTGCYNLTANENVNSFRVYCHVPVLFDGQSPIIINDVWTTPINKVTSYRIVDNYSGSNALLEVNISDMEKYETIKLFFSVSVIIKGNIYLNLPRFILPRPNKLPNDVKKWLSSTDFIQADHPEIIAKAKELSKWKINVFRIARRIAFFTEREIEYKGGGGQDALITLRNGYGVCTGKANLAAALLRANGIPARVLMVSTTHYIVEYYAYPYGWVRLESDLGEMPVPRQFQTVNFCAHPEDETESNVVNGQHPYVGVITYWGTSDPRVFYSMNYDEWTHQDLSVLFTTIKKTDKAIDLTKWTWNYYVKYMDENLTEEQRDHFQNATNYQRIAVECLKKKNICEYLKIIELSLEEYSKIDNKIKGIIVGSDIIGDLFNPVSEILSFIDDCNIDQLVIDFGWITVSWYQTKFNRVKELIKKAQQKDIPVWLMYRARTVDFQLKHLQHQVHKNGEIDKREICFTDEECKNWSIDWSFKLLEKFPNVDGMIIYNPGFKFDCCFCNKCLEEFKKDTGIQENPLHFVEGSPEYNIWLEWRANQITEFIKEWKYKITQNNPNLLTGAVLLPPQYMPIGRGQNLSILGDTLDIVFPFVALDDVTDNEIAGQICNDTNDIVSCKTIANIKIYGPYNNTDSDIVEAIKSSLNSNGDGFTIWRYDCLDPEIYDIEKIKDAYNGIYH